MSLIVVPPGTGRWSVRFARENGTVADVVGDLLSRSDDAWRVLPADGPVVEVPARAVLAARSVPTQQAVRPNSGIDRLQRLMARGWPGTSQERLGGWLLRYGHGFTGRANSVLAVGDPGLSLSEALAECSAAYASRGLPLRVQVPAAIDGPTPPIDDALAHCERDPDTLVMVADLRRLQLPVPAELTFQHADSPDPAWLGRYHYRGGALPDTAVAVITASPANYLAASTGDQLAGIARVARTEDWAGFASVEVAESLRGNGFGRAIMAEAIRWARDDGARFGYLQVFAHNSAAVNLYRTLGFTVHHRYWYRTAA